MSTLDEIAARDAEGALRDQERPLIEFASQAADDRHILLGLVREAREALTIAASLSNDDPRVTEALARLTEGSDRT